ncbi:MAG: Decaprenyl-phosphate phosphoribosyltransferase [Fimbriimonadaceae bacterium]|nr:Decaprenyl-phosphate phosphoribosyltransferase [Fimbriimonadaceae bacterium]
MGLASLLKLMRPKQWTKNLLVFAALIVTHSYNAPDKVRMAALAFVAMCLAGSATYCLNDALDAEKDRRHPKKRHRPVASGAVPQTVAIGLGAILAIGSLAIGWTISLAVVVVLSTYLVLQLGYNFGLKNVAVTDVFIICLGFVLRAAIGAVAIAVTISGWLLFCTAALALMLGFAKRRHEFISQGEAAHESRASLAHYSQTALDHLVGVSAGGAAVCYAVYSVDSQTASQYPALILTSLPVVYAIARYSLLVFANEEGGEPENLLFADPHLIISILLFIALLLLATSGVEIPFLEKAR